MRYKLLNDVVWNNLYFLSDGNCFYKDGFYI